MEMLQYNNPKGARFCATAVVVIQLGQYQRTLSWQRLQVRAVETFIVASTCDVTYRVRTPT